jgi:hypothetical protein
MKVPDAEEHTICLLDITICLSAYRDVLFVPNVRERERERERDLYGRNLDITDRDVLFVPKVCVRERSMAEILI